MFRYYRRTEITLTQMPQNLKDIQVIYASASGNVAAVCERVATILEKQGYNVSLHRAETSTIELLKSNTLFILATSTWEHGVINPYFDSLMREMSETDLGGKFSAFIGLGDTRYEPVLFCEGMNQLQELFKKQGGVTIGVPLKINGDPYSLLDTMVTDWAEKVAKEFAQFDYRKAEGSSKNQTNQVDTTPKMPDEIEIKQEE